VFHATVTVDPARATLDDIVTGFIKKDLGFGEREFVLNNDVGVIYDVEETDNLPKKLSDLGKYPQRAGCATVGSQKNRHQRR
jgi:ubiquitin-like 1-activating enzyme E1 B